MTNLNLTYTTPNPHGHLRELLIDAQLDALDREEEEREEEES